MPTRGPVPRRGAFTRLIDHFHTHPKGRLHEFLFWAGLGISLGAIAFLAWWTDNLSTPLALMAGVISLSLFLWAFLPQRKARPPPPLPPGKRGTIAKNVKASKAEKKRGGPPPPGPPIRRG